MRIGGRAEAAGPRAHIVPKLGNGQRIERARGLEALFYEAVDVLLGRLRVEPHRLGQMREQEIVHSGHNVRPPRAGAAGARPRPQPTSMPYRARALILAVSTKLTI